MVAGVKSREDILDTIRKLMAMAQHEGSNEHEAATAAAKAQRLLDEHEVAEAELVAAGKMQAEDYTIVNRPYTPWNHQYIWRKELWFGVATANHCRAYVYPNSPQGSLLGKPHLIEITSYLIDTLGETIHRLGLEAWKAYRRGGEYRGEEGHAKTVWYRSFCLGAVRAVVQRMSEERETAPAEIRALVVKTDAELAEAQDRLVGKVRTGRGGKSEFNGDTAAKGRTEGKKIAIKRGIKAGEGEEPKALPGGKRGKAAKAEKPAKVAKPKASRKPKQNNGTGPGTGEEALAALTETAAAPADGANVTDEIELPVEA